MRRVENSKKTGKSKLIAVAKLVVFLLVVAGIWHRLNSQWAELEAHQQQPGQLWASLDLGWLVAGGMFYLGGLLPCAWFWRRILRTLDQPAPWLAVIKADYIGHLGKYVPGKALVVVLRAGLLPKCDKAVASVSVIYETLTMMAVGVLLAAGVLLARQQFGWPLWLALALAAATGLPVLPPVFARVYRKLGVKHLAPAMAERVEHLSFANLAAAVVPIFLGWVLMGFSLWSSVAAIHSSPPLNWGDLPLLTACVALSLVAGFVSLIPGGAGVRELVLMELLQPRLGVNVAFQASILLRLTWLLAEVVISVILYTLRTTPLTAETSAALPPHT